MGALRELADMNRNFGLGGRYFLFVFVILLVLLGGLFLWGRVEAEAEAEAVAPPVAAAPSVSPTY